MRPCAGTGAEGQERQERVAAGRRQELAARPSARPAMGAAVWGSGRVLPSLGLLARGGRSPGCCSWLLASPARVREEARAHAQPRSPACSRRALCACPTLGARSAGGEPSAHAQPEEPCPQAALSHGVRGASGLRPWGGLRGMPLEPGSGAPSPVCADSGIKTNAIGLPGACLICSLRIQLEERGRRLHLRHPQGGAWAGRAESLGKERGSVAFPPVPAWPGYPCHALSFTFPRVSAEPPWLSLQVAGLGFIRREGALWRRTRR